MGIINVYISKRGKEGVENTESTEETRLYY